MFYMGLSLGMDVLIETTTGVCRLFIATVCFPQGKHVDCYLLGY